MSLSKEQVEASLSELDTLLAQVDGLLKPILSKPLSEHTRSMTPMENAKFQVTLSYTMNTLFYLYMKLQNANLVGHQTVKDMERLKEYMKKIQDAERYAQAGSEDTAGHTLKLNKVAAKRFIQNSLSSGKSAAGATNEPEGSPDGDNEEGAGSDPSMSQDDEIDE